MRYIFLPFALFVAGAVVFSAIIAAGHVSPGYNTYGTYGSGYVPSVSVVHVHNHTYVPSYTNRRTVIRRTSVTRSVTRRVGH